MDYYYVCFLIRFRCHDLVSGMGNMISCLTSKRNQMNEVRTQIREMGGQHDISENNVTKSVLLWCLLLENFEFLTFKCLNEYYMFNLVFVLFTVVHSHENF